MSLLEPPSLGSAADRALTGVLDLSDIKTEFQDPFKPQESTIRLALEGVERVGLDEEPADG